MARFLPHPSDVPVQLTLGEQPDISQVRLYQSRRCGLPIPARLALRHRPADAHPQPGSTGLLFRVRCLVPKAQAGLSGRHRLYR